MKWLKWTLGLLVISVVAFFYINTVIIKDAERMSGFKQSEWGTYHFFVDKDIKNAPRISADYYFRFRRLDGPSPEISGIVYRDATETAALESYLTTLGYHYVTTDEYGDRWEKEDWPIPEFYLWQDKERRMIFLTKYTL